MDLGCLGNQVTVKLKGWLPESKVSSACAETVYDRWDLFVHYWFKKKQQMFNVTNAVFLFSVSFLRLSFCAADWSGWRQQPREWPPHRVLCACVCRHISPRLTSVKLVFCQKRILVRVVGCSFNQIVERGLYWDRWIVSLLRRRHRNGCFEQRMPPDRGLCVTRALCD